MILKSQQIRRAALLITVALLIFFAQRSMDSSPQKPPSRGWGGVSWVDWSPDGEKVVFESLDLPRGSSVWVVNIDGSNPSRLTDSEENANVPIWSPDGKWIAYLLNLEDIAIIASDGSDRTIITTDLGLDHPIYLYPFFEWSPDSQSIVISVFVPVEELPLLGSIWVVRVDGSASTQIVEEQPIYDLYLPNWSADGQQVLFTTLQAKGRPSAIGIVDIETLSQTTLAIGPYSGAYFSPDTTSIAAFSVAECDQGFDIVLIEVESLETTNLTHGSCPALPSPLQWSPDSQQIAFDTSLDSFTVLNIRTMEAKSFTGSRPVWSSDGEKIAYISSVSIWILNMENFSTTRVAMEGE